MFSQVPDSLVVERCTGSGALFSRTSAMADAVGMSHGLCQCWTVSLGGDCMVTNCGPQNLKRLHLEFVSFVVG